MTTLSQPEFGVWLASRRHPETFNIHQVWELRGDLDAAALQDALVEIAGRHQVFARRLVTDAGVPAWRPVRSAAPDCAIVDGAVDPARWATEEGRHRFDLAEDCLLRFRLLRIGDRHWLLSLLVHHLACDGLSLGILVAELGAAYAARTQGGPPLAPAVQPPHRDVVERNAPSDYWSHQLADARWPELFPTDRAEPSPTGDVVTVPLDAADVAAIRSGARRLGTTPFLFGLSALYLTLRRYGQPNDLMVTSAFANRSGATADVVGCLAQMIPLRQRWTGDPTGKQFVAAVRRTMAEALAHLAEPPYEIADLFGGHARGQTISFQANPEPAVVLPSVTALPRPDLHNGVTRFDLEVDLQLGAAGGLIALTYRHNPAVSAEAAGAFASMYQRALLGMAELPDRPVATVELLDDRQRNAAVLRSAPRDSDTVLDFRLDGWFCRPALALSLCGWLFGWSPRLGLLHHPDPSLS